MEKDAFDLEEFRSKPSMSFQQEQLKAHREQSLVLQHKDYGPVLGALSQLSTHQALLCTGRPTL